MYLRWPMYRHDPQRTGSLKGCAITNAPPMVDEIDPLVANSDKLLEFTLTASDPDGDRSLSEKIAERKDLILQD